MRRSLILALIMLFALGAAGCREKAEWPDTGYDLDGDGPPRREPMDRRVGQGSSSPTPPAPAPAESPPPGGGSGGGSEPVPIPEGEIAAFVAFGDWGTGGDDQVAVAGAIGTYCAANPCEFVLTLGDNFYSSGVESTDDPQWEEKYRGVYDGLGLPFYASLGNHDNDGNIQAQIDYSAVDPSWNMPDEDYSFTWPEGAESPLVEFFVFNSDYPHFREASVQSWLDGAIAASEATWKVLVMHHPICTNGNHGDDDQENNEFLLPIIGDRIDLVLSGHDHNFGYLRCTEGGASVEQLVIGTGGAGLRDVDEEDPRVVSTGSFHGFGWFAVGRDQVTFRMIAVDGSVFYSTTWEK